MITLGISGFDSPVAQYSIPEAASTIEALQAIIDLYRAELTKKDESLYAGLSQKLAQAKQFLLNNRSGFNRFNRLEFIIKYANPVSKRNCNNQVEAGF